jgi:hypothetical protein
VLLPRGTLNLALSFSGTGARTGHAEHCPDINGPGCAAMPVPDEWHDLRLFFGELRLQAEYGITDWLSIDLMWALRIVRVDFELQDHGTRMPIAPPYGTELHHRTETLVGLTDPWLSLHAAKVLGRWAFVFRAGLTLPVGSTVANPFALGRRGEAHQHIQMGTGTVDPLAGVELRRALGRFSLTGWLLARASLYENRHGYRAGSRVLAGVSVASDLWRDRWWFTLGALVYNEQPERWDGLTETEGNLGRTDLLVDTAITWRFHGRWAATLGARVPFYSHAVGAQLNTPAIAQLTLSRSFDLVRAR